MCPHTRILLCLCRAVLKTANGTAGEGGSIWKEVRCGTRAWGQQPAKDVMPAWLRLAV